MRRRLALAGLFFTACGPAAGPQLTTNGSVTSTTTSTTATSTTGTSTTSTSSTSTTAMMEPPPPPPPLPICGDGTRDPDEECDDGNYAHLDGCDPECRFEQVLRFNSMVMLFTTDTLCRDNAIGQAIGSAAQDTLQTSITAAIRDGTISTLCRFDGLTNLGGGNTSSTLGCVTGSPVPHRSYSGASDLDWWYHASANDLDDEGAPRASLGGTIHNGAFTAGPGELALSLSLGGGSSQLALSSVIVRSRVGAVRSPARYAGLPRGHRDAENLDPSLASFGSLTSGQLCGNVSAASLATLPVPGDLVQGGQHACWEGYTEESSMLDVLVGGCSIFFVRPIAATQPDQEDLSVPVAGSGGPYRLHAGSDRAVEACTDAEGDWVDLQDCLDAAAYSIGLRFTAGRVMITGVE